MYRRSVLNTLLTDDDYDLPLVQAYFDNTASVKVICGYHSPIDIFKGFLRFEAPESDRNWTSFKWENKLYSLCLAPLGIKAL